MYPDAVADLADAVLVEAEAALAVAGRPPVERTYRSHGQPAWDLCTTDTLAVYVAGLAPSPASPSRPGCATIWRAEVHVQIVRCAPTIDNHGKAPSADALDGNAADLLADLWVLAASIGDLGTAAVGSCDGFAAANARPLGPFGGAAGWDVPFFVTVVGLPVGS